MAAKRKITLERRAVVRRILKDRGEALVVTGIGNAAQDTAAAGDHDTLATLILWSVPALGVCQGSETDRFLTEGHLAG